MGNFQLKIDVEPKDIPSLDDAHKQDCADAINRAINSTFKFTMIFAFTVIAVFAVYTIFGFTYLLRMNKILPQIPVTLPMTAMAVIIFEFISGIMKRWALAVEILLHAVIVFVSLLHFQTLIAVPFAVYGVFLHLKLLTMVPHYDVISKLKGYPDFTPLPIGDVIKKISPEKISEEKASDNSEAALQEEKKSEKPAEEISAEENSPDEAVKEQPSEEKNSSEKEELPEKEGPSEKENSPEDEKEKSLAAENKPGEEKNQPRKSNSSRKKKKKRGRSSK